MQQKKLSAFDIVQKAKKHVIFTRIILGNIDDTKLDADIGMLDSMRRALEEGGDTTTTDAFIACCMNGFRETAIEILRSGQVSVGKFRGSDEFLGFLKACSIPVDDIPEGLKSKLKRMQRGKSAFGM